MKLVLITFLLASATVLGQTENWRLSQPVSTTNQLHAAVAFDSSGGSVIATREVTPVQRLLVRRYSLQGSKGWEWATNSPALVEQQPREAVIAADGAVYLATARVSSESVHAVGIVKLTGAGEFSWEWSENTDSEADVVCKPLIDGSGNVYLAWQNSRPDGETVSAAKFTAAGEHLWTKEFEGMTTMSRMLRLANAIIIARTNVMAIDENGEVLWTRTSEELGVRTNEFADGIVLPDQSFVLGGSSYDGSRKVSTVVKMSAAGEKLWSRSYGEAPRVNLDQWFATGLTADEQGNIYVSIGTTSWFRPGTPLVIKYSPDGRRIWIARMLGLDFTEPVLQGITYSSGSLFAVGDGLRGQSENCPGSGKMTGGRDVFVARISAIDGGVQWAELIDFHDRADSFHAPAVAINEAVTVPVFSAGCDDHALSLVQFDSELIAGAPRIIAHPNDVPIGSSLHFEISAAGENLQYQWFSYSGFGTSSEIAGAIGPQMTSSPVESDTSFAVRVSNEFGTVWSRQAHITVEPRLGGPYLLGEQVFLTLTVDRGAYYDLEGSSDLLNWTHVSTESDFSGAAFIETTFRPDGAQFFRARERY